MTTPPPAPVREYAPWTIWLAAVCIWLRSALGLLMGIGIVAAGFDSRNQVGGAFSAPLMAIAFAVLFASIAWIRLSVSLLRRRRWARLTTIALEAASVLFGLTAFLYTNGSTLIGAFYLVFGALALIVVRMGPSIEWCDK
jgi:hypothetical protein